MVSKTSSAGMASDLLRYLQEARETVLRGLDGLDDYDARRPLTPSGSNILGLVKHLAGIESGYLGDCVGRPSPICLPWVADGSIWDDADMWATPEQSREYLTGLYRQAWEHSDTSITQLGLETPAHVAWWAPGQRDTTVGHLLVRVVAETAQHAGHVDILRESIDGQGGRNHEEYGGQGYWAGYVARIQAAADTYRSS
ncbi:DinB family protein [Actinopolyspora sp. H202]|uniref:DinB family protein n=1 Tax=Actinopolyspora sp. H202 TaxID=1500456 RepID=UPI003EE7FDD6